MSELGGREPYGQLAARPAVDPDPGQAWLGHEAGAAGDCRAERASERLKTNGTRLLRTCLMSSKSPGAWCLARGAAILMAPRGDSTWIRRRNRRADAWDLRCGEVFAGIAAPRKTHDGGRHAGPPARGAIPCLPSAAHDPGLGHLLDCSREHSLHVPRWGFTATTLAASFWEVYARASRPMKTASPLGVVRLSSLPLEATFAASFPLGCAGGAILAARLLDRWGRRGTLIAVLPVASILSMLTAASPNVQVRLKGCRGLVGSRCSRRCGPCRPSRSPLPLRECSCLRGVSVQSS